MKRYALPWIWHAVYGITIGLLLIQCFYPACFSNKVGNSIYRVGWALSRSELSSLMGPPQRIYKPGVKISWGGAYPKPPDADGREIWVYTKLMKLTFIYFNDDGKVEMVFYATT
ncbi:MAG: hypothetical protein ACYC0V_06370 [Armatimonadota bacterium]